MPGKSQPGKPGSRLIRAAGGVAWRPGPGGEPEVLLVHRKKYDDWSLPKGKTEPGEALPETAVREVLEEGGAELALGRRLASVRYGVGGRPKRVHYWAAQVLSVDAGAVPNAEVDEVAWLPVDRAADKLSYAHDQPVLAEFAALPAGTVPLILLRHAKAQDKHGWKRDDAVRPLAGPGRDESRALAGLLTCFAPRPRLISSPALRCTETLRPLSWQTGEQIRPDPALYIHSKPRPDGTDPEDDLPGLVRAAIASGQPTVLCAHRENIPALLEAALAVLAGHQGPAGPGGGEDEPAGAPSLRGTASAAATGADAVVPASRPWDWDDPLPTSAFWVLNIAPPPAASRPAAPVPAEADPTAPDPAAGGPRAVRAWWPRSRARRGAGAGAVTAQAARPGARAGAQAGSTAAQASAPASFSPAPLGVLISADRYTVDEH